MAGLDRIAGNEVPPDMNGAGGLPPGPAVQSSDNP